MDTGTELPQFSNYSPWNKKSQCVREPSPNLCKRLNASNASYSISGVLIYKKNNVPFLKSSWCAKGVLAMGSYKYVRAVCWKGGEKKGEKKATKNPLKAMAEWPYFHSVKPHLHHALKQFKCCPIWFPMQPQQMTTWKPETPHAAESAWALSRHTDPGQENPMAGFREEETNKQKEIAFLRMSLLILFLFSSI